MGRWWVVVVVLAALVATACGSEDIAGPTTTTTGPTSTSATTTAPGGPGTIPPLVSVDPGDAAIIRDGPTTTVEAAPPPTVTEPPTVTATTLPTADQPAPQPLGPGSPRWFSRNGNAVVIADDDPAQPGATCAGATQPVLYRQPTGPQPRTLAVLDDDPTLTGERAFLGDDRVSLLATCDGLLTSLWVGDEVANGTMARFEPVALSAPVSTVGPINRGADGGSFLVAATSTSTSEAAVVRVDAQTGAVRTLFTGDHVQAVEMADGSFLALTVAGQLRHIGENGELMDSRPGRAVAASPTGVATAVFTADGLELTHPGGVVTIEVAGAGSDELGPWELVVADDGRTLFTRRSAVDQPLWLATADGALVQLLDADQWRSLVLSSDGARLAASRPVADPADPFAEETVVIDLPS